MLLPSCGGALHEDPKKHCKGDYTVKSQWKIKQIKKRNNNSKNRNKDNLKLPLSLFLISECLEKVREMSIKGFDKVAGVGGGGVDKHHCLSKPLFTMCIPKTEMQPPLPYHSSSL